MGHYEAARAVVRARRDELSDQDPRIRVIGIAHDERDEIVIEITRNVTAPVRGWMPERIGRLDGFRVVDFDDTTDPLPLGRVRAPPPPPQRPEQEPHQTLYGGLQLHSFDHDDRRGDGFMTLGTLGWFAIDRDGEHCLVSNNHVLAACNAARKQDRIYQPDESRGRAPRARLREWKPLIPTPPHGKRAYNQIDAALAGVDATDVHKAYLPIRAGTAFAPRRVQPARAKTEVGKVGSGSEPTRGRIVATDVQVRVDYDDLGVCWFEDVFAVAGQDPPFSSAGDSGALVVARNGDAMGMVFAGTAERTYCCELWIVEDELRCRFVF